MNDVWAVLNNGRNPNDDMEFGRRVTPRSVPPGWAPTVVESLFPEEDEQYRCFLIESVVQTCLESTLGSRFLALDPVNTYANRFPDYSHDHYESSPAATPMSVLLLPKEDADSRDVLSTWACAVSSTGVVEINDAAPAALEMSGGMSKEFPLGSSLVLRLRGTPATFSFNVVSRRTPLFRVSSFLERLSEFNSGVEWSSIELKRAWREESPVDRVAAFILNLATNVLGS